MTMPFDGFLGDPRARPTGLRRFGYLVSLSLHVPPMTVFVISWLTRALLVDGGFDLPEPRGDVVYYQVPVALMTSFPGVGAARGVGGGTPTAGGDGVARRGAAGPAKRRTRRPLVLHRGTHRVKTVALEKALVGPEEFVPDDDGTAGASGTGTAGLGDGPGGGAGQTGPGGEGNGPGGMGLAKAPEPHRGEGPRPRRKGRASKDEGTGKEFEGDDETVVGAPLPGRPARISMDHAAYLRTYENFPSPLPESCWPPGRISNAILVEICVTERGDVNEVVVRESTGNDADAFLVKAIRSWRYRPRMVTGERAPVLPPHPD